MIRPEKGGKVHAMTARAALPASLGIPVGCVNKMLRSRHSSERISSDRPI